MPVLAGTGVADRVAGPTNARILDLSMVPALVWLAGMTLIFVYLAFKTVKMLDMLSSAKKVRGKRYYVSDDINTSFVLGILHPRIYMQSGLSEKEESYILLHERTHIKNKDHITRLLGVLAVCIHWFNPLVWIAFSKMCTDLEMRCDEAVVEKMGSRIMPEYCRSMVNHALERDSTGRGLSVAFSGDNCSGREIKLRINNLINYKKISKISAVLIILFALTLTVVISTKAQVSNKKEAALEEVVTEEKVGAPVSVPGNINLTQSEKSPTSKR